MKKNQITTITLILFTILSNNLFGKEYILTRHGVKSDSTIINTVAIQKVIDLAHKKGGGTIVVPKGVFLTGALFFKPNTQLKLMAGAELKGSDKIAHYPIMPSRIEGQNLDYFPALINAYQVDGFSITGPGRINGNGHAFWSQFWNHRDSLRNIGIETTNLEVHRPRLVFIWDSNNIAIKDVKLHNSGFWTTHLYKCNDVLIEGCDIRAPYKPVPAPSSDGIDLDVCRNVTIRNCYISVHDDGIAIKGGKGPKAHLMTANGISENIVIEDCTFGPVHAVLTLGSECTHARNIVMRNSKLINTNAPILKLKMRPDTFQTYENIVIENISGSCRSVIDLSTWRQFFDMQGHELAPYGIVRNILFKDIEVKSRNIGTILGNKNDNVNNITFQNINITADQPRLNNKHDGVKYENVIVNGYPYNGE